MSHQTCRSLPHKHNELKTSVNQKVKRFKTRKERNQIRGLERNRSHACPQHSRKVGIEKSQHHGFHQSHSVVSSRKEKTFAKPFVTQKPTIIAEGRLTSIRGLFSHEIRSLDIERLVSDELKTANKLPYRLCSTPVKIDSDSPEINSPISPHENNKLNIEVPLNKSVPSFSKLDSGTHTLTGNGSEREQISVSVREAVKKLSARVCQTLELNVPKRSLLKECREMLLKTLQKTHSFHLKDNMRKLHSLRNGKQTDSFGSGQTHEDCCSYVHFSHGVGNEDSEHSRNMEMWKDHFTQREEVKQDLDRDASMKKRRVQAERILSHPVSIIEPFQSHTEMFDQLRTARLSRDCFRTQHYPSTPVFRQDQYASPISSVPTWTSHPYEPGFQQLFGDSQRKCESTKNVGFDLISHQWKENTDPLFNSYYKYKNTEQKAQKTFLERSSCWSDQLQVQDVRERWAPISFPASFPSEGFRYKPYPHPSNSQHGSDLLDINSSLGMIWLN